MLIFKNDTTCIVNISTMYVYGKLLADNPTRAGSRPGAFSSVYTTDNTGVMYVASGNKTENGTIVYYFAGNALNNWVKFGQDSNGSSLYWRIIRTNEDDSIKMLYSGTNLNTTTGYIGLEEFNPSSKNPLYVGYMYGTSGSISNNRKNMNNSLVKTAIDNWYSNGLNRKTDASGNIYDTYVSKTAIYCNDRAYTGTYNTGNNYFSFASYTRLKSYKSPSYRCDANQIGNIYGTANVADKFSVSTSKGGNGKPQYPVALITADEVSFAGGLYGTDAPVWYYYNKGVTSITGNTAWWTMTPSAWDGYDTADSFVWGSSSPGRLSNGSGFKNAIRPVLSLKYCVKWKSGNGSSSTPYEVELDSTCASAEN